VSDIEGGIAADAVRGEVVSRHRDASRPLKRGVRTPPALSLLSDRTQLSRRVRVSADEISRPCTGDTPFWRLPHYNTAPA
jgi:hypothetical protein